MPMNVRQVSRWLRRKYPVQRPVVIRVVKPQDNLHGICLLSKDRVLIRLCRASESMMCETLLEEWAHVLRDECPIPYEEGNEHDPLFWAILADITRQYRGE